MCVQNKCASCTLYTVVCTYSVHIAYVDILLIGWQAYRGDQMHRKNSPT